MIFRSLNYAPQRLFDLWKKEEQIYYLFLPYNREKMEFAELDDGFVLRFGAAHRTLILLLGEIKNFEELGTLQGGLSFVFPGKFSDESIREDYVDFCIDWNQHDVKRYKIKNSTARRVAEDKIEIFHYKNSEDFFANLAPGEFENLLQVWRQKTKTQVGVSDVEQKYLCKYMNSEYAEIICYKRAGALAGFQVFEVFGEVYFQINILDYEKMGRSCIAWVHPIEFFAGRKIHYFGAIKGDRRLYNHKLRMCRGKFWTFTQVCYNRTTKNKLEKLEQIKQLYTNKLKGIKNDSNRKD